MWALRLSGKMGYIIKTSMGWIMPLAPPVNTWYIILVLPTAVQLLQGWDLQIYTTVVLMCYN